MRYSLSHTHTAAVNFETMQRVADYLFMFRNSPDFQEYKVLDTVLGKMYSVKNSDSLNAIEIY